MKKINGVLTDVTDEDLKLLEENPKEFWEGVTYIGEYAFCNCKSLKNVTIAEGVTSIGNSAFYECKSLNIIVIPKSVTSIGPYAFDDHTKVVNLNTMSKTSGDGRSI